MPSSNASSSCRIDWRPSRWLAVALVGLGLLAGLSLMLCALPLVVAGPGAVLAACAGAMQARRHLSQATLSVDWLGGDAPAYLTGRGGVARLQDVGVVLRGPLATLCGTDATGRRRRLAWWPDTLTPDDRRPLRLAAAVSRRSANPLRKQAA